jgi:prevent-host-death family protein
MKKRMSALEARKNLGQLLEEVFYKGSQFIIERKGKPMAALIPVWIMEQWREHRKVFFDVIEQLWEKNKEASVEVIEEEVKEAVNKVREKRRWND